jgi:hypothetical protein
MATAFCDEETEHVFTFIPPNSGYNEAWEQQLSDVARHACVRVDINRMNTPYPVILQVLRSWLELRSDYPDTTDVKYMVWSVFNTFEKPCPGYFSILSTLKLMCTSHTNANRQGRAFCWSPVRPTTHRMCTQHN